MSKRGYLSPFVLQLQATQRMHPDHSQVQKLMEVAHVYILPGFLQVDMRASRCLRAEKLDGLSEPFLRHSLLGLSLYYITS